jgi:predicted membrane channel-forming protein YqfA (hemolysin III family)
MHAEMQPEMQAFPAFGVTAGAVLFAFLIFKNFFGYLTPDKLAGDFKPCDGDWAEADELGCATLSHIPQQPVNTYSNLAYLAAGLVIQFMVDTGPAFVFAVTMTYLCIGSTLYHATSTGWAGVLDVSGIITVFPAITVYAVAGYFRVGDSSWTPLAMFLVGGGLVFLLAKRIHKYMRAVIGISLGLSYAIMLSSMWRNNDWRYQEFLWWSLGLFIAGFVSWELDRHRKFRPRRWGHGVWHVATAAASALIFYGVHLTQPDITVR